MRTSGTVMSVTKKKGKSKMSVHPGMLSNQVEKDLAEKRELMGAEAFANFITQQKYSDEEKAQFAKTIKEFNELWYRMNQQTWCNTKWRGVHILKPATDLWIYQELIHTIKPDLIIETGTYYGGSAFYMRDLMNFVNVSGRVITIDITHERLMDEAKIPGIDFYLGSSVADETIVYVKSMIAAYDFKKVMVILDSDHSEEHVLKELELYAPLVSIGSALIVEDTNNHPGPIGAVCKWYPENQEKFQRDIMCEKFMLTFNRDGYFERIS